LSALQDVDLVVASRLHGVILSHLIAKPTLAISYDPKIDTHMKEIEQTEYCVSIDHFDSTVLIERFIALRDARERESIHLARAVEHYSELVGLQYDLLFGGMDPASHVDGMEGLSVAQERL
jgi:polysaccharide pyruvyl transferase WcaK-like protein